MSEDLTELQRRMLSRKLQYCTQCAVLNGVTLVAAILVASLVSVFVWKEDTSPGFRTDAEHATSYIEPD